MIDIAQLHGDESPEYCKMIKAPVIKYFNCSHGAPHDLDKYDVDYFCLIRAQARAGLLTGAIFPKQINRFSLRAEYQKAM